MNPDGSGKKAVLWGETYGIEEARGGRAPAFAAQGPGYPRPPPKLLCQMWCTPRGAPQQGPLRQTRRQHGDGKRLPFPYKQGARNANGAAAEPKDGGRKERP